MLKERVITAAVALPLLVAAIVWGPASLIGGLFGLLALWGWLEYRLLVGRPHWALVAVGLAAGEAMIAALGLGRPGLAWAGLLAGLTGLAVAAIILYGRRGSAWTEVERLWLGFVLIFGSLGCLAGLAARPHSGRGVLLVLLAFVFATDSGAFFVGRKWGRAKLCPAVSPGKTWAGLWGGLGSGTLLGLVLGLLEGGAWDWLAHGGLGLALALLATVGDLLVSLVKRTYQVKDSGKLLPGHGGLLDRLDSFTLAGPWLYWFLSVGRLW